MKKIIRKIAQKLGIVTHYHVTACYVNQQGVCGYLDVTLGIAPWLHMENGNDLHQFFQAKAKFNDSNPIILNITKLGI